MVDDDRYGRNEPRGYGQRDDRDYGRGYGAYSQGGSYGSGYGGAYGDRGYDTRGHDRDDYRRRGRDEDRDARYGNRDSQRDVAIDETDRLIASNKVEGTRVYNRRGERLGTIYNFMVEKRTGRVEYAVMSFGGFLGIGERYYPLPWQVLRYDEREGGYVIDLEGDIERDLARAPSFARGQEPRFDRAYGQHVYGFYGLQYPFY